MHQMGVVSMLFFSRSHSLTLFSCFFRSYFVVVVAIVHPLRLENETNFNQIKWMAHITYSIIKPIQWNSQQLKWCSFYLCSYVSAAFFTLYRYVRICSACNGANFVCAYMRSLYRSLNEPCHQSDTGNQLPISRHCLAYIVHLWSRFV